jgi:folylpolyglutamate synthase/dihydropteroate synthase
MTKRDFGDSSPEKQRGGSCRRRHSWCGRRDAYRNGFETTASARDRLLVNRFDRLFIPLLGDHQLLNAASAVGAVEALSFHGISIAAKAVREGLKQVKWPGRLEIVQKHPLVVLDCAKDTEGARALKETLQKDFKYRKLIAVVSISSDKNIPAMIDQFAQVANRFVVTSHGVMAESLTLPESLRRWTGIISHTSSCRT